MLIVIPDVGKLAGSPLTTIPLTAGAVHVLSGMDTTEEVELLCGAVVVAESVKE